MKNHGNNVQKGVWVYFYFISFIFQKIIEIRAIKVGYFKQLLWCLIVKVLVGQLMILPPGVGWDIMWYESYPLPSCHKLRDCSYSIKLSYTTTSSTLQVHLPHVVPTISPTVLSPESAPPQCTAHIWDDWPPFQIWSHTTSLCTP